MATITINPGAATDDAVQIDSIISDITRDMDELNSVIQRTIPNDIETTWSDTLKSNWNKYYDSSIPETMEDMKKSSANLRLAVQEALAYDTESK
ncbi:MAG: hypothetical protein IKE70_02410 [Bacilli bacterium]|nr:hypothetical protein [Bacilli bacterium]